MKTLVINAFEALAKELGATVIFQEFGPSQKGCEIDFETLLYFTETIYLWDRKHGMSKVTLTQDDPELGPSILQGAVKGEKTRFSYIGIYDNREHTLTAYPGTMAQVKAWRRNKESEARKCRVMVDYLNNIASSAAFRGSM